MIADSENGRINLILTKEVSRFARNTVDTLNYTRRLSELNIGVIFMNDGIDTREKDGELRLRTCPHRVNVRIFRHNFVGGKAKIRRRAVALQGFGA